MAAGNKFNFVAEGDILTSSLFYLSDEKTARGDRKVSPWGKGNGIKLAFYSQLEEKRS